MEMLKTLGLYVPLFQTVMWAVLILVAVRLFLPQLRAMLEAIKLRVERGSGLELAGVVKLPADLRALEPAPQQADVQLPASYDQDLPYSGISSEITATPTSEGEPTAQELNRQRDEVYEKSKNLFLVHAIQPSKEVGQKYDIFIYLVRHEGGSFKDVAYADFFLGRYWGNRVFRRYEEGGKIGLSTAAYGTFLCTCWVQMKSGERIFLTRYIDFEMGRLFERGG